MIIVITHAEYIELVVCNGSNTDVSGGALIPLLFPLASLSPLSPLSPPFPLSSLSSPPRLSLLVPELPLFSGSPIKRKAYPSAQPKQAPTDHRGYCFKYWLIEPNGTRCCRELLRVPSRVYLAISSTSLIHGTMCLRELQRSQLVEQLLPGNRVIIRHLVAFHPQYIGSMSLAFLSYHCLSEHQKQIVPPLVFAPASNQLRIYPETACNGMLETTASTYHFQCSSQHST